MRKAPLARHTIPRSVTQGASSHLQRTNREGAAHQPACAMISNACLRKQRASIMNLSRRSLSMRTHSRCMVMRKARKYATPTCAACAPGTCGEQCQLEELCNGPADAGMEKLLHGLQVLHAAARVRWSCSSTCAGHVH